MKPVNTPPAPGPRPPAPFLKRLLFRLLRRDPDAVVVSFCSGDEALAARMVEEVRGLVPDRRHFVVEAPPGESVADLARAAAGIPRLAHRARACPVHPGAESAAAGGFPARPPQGPGLQHAAGAAPPAAAHTGLLRRCFCAACRWIASSSARAGSARGSATAPSHPAISASLRAARPWRAARASACWRPISLTRFLTAAPFACGTCCARPRASSILPFSPSRTDPWTAGPVAEFCSRIMLVEKPRYREPRWSTLLPPEVHEFRSPAMRAALARYGR